MLPKCKYNLHHRLNKIHGWKWHKHLQKHATEILYTQTQQVLTGFLLVFGLLTFFCELLQYVLQVQSSWAKVNIHNNQHSSKYTHITIYEIICVIRVAFLVIPIFGTFTQYLTVEVATGQKIQSDCILYMDLLYWNLLNVWIWKNTNSPLIDCLTWFTGFFLQFEKYSYCWQKARLHLHALYA